MEKLARMTPSYFWDESHFLPSVWQITKPKELTVF
jgi:hypothetical protein